MKVLIVSFHCAPEVTPRAFRTSSIIDGLSSQGCEVELIAPVKPGCSKSKVLDDSVSWGRSRSFARKLIGFALPGGKELKYIPLYLKLLKGRDADVVISIGLPFMVHLAVAICRKYLNLSARRFIFDYGDPYSSNPVGRSCFYAERIERWALQQCDIILTPIQDAVPLFENIAHKKCTVEVVPQGYKIKEVSLHTYCINPIPTFCYSGILYKGIREPLEFLNYLASLETDFKFVVYTDIYNADTRNILSPFKDALGDKLVINGLVPRDECLKIMSKMDFLVNFSNVGGVQQPSKLIDYSLTNRPYLSINPDQVSFSEFDRYMKSNYKGFKSLELADYDQDLIAKKILSLAKVNGEAC